MGQIKPTNDELLQPATGKCIYRRARLAFASLTGAHITWAKLEYANLTEINFSGAFLKGVRFWGADLSKADFGGAKVRDVDFQYANLIESDFHGADISESNFTAANLENANLMGLQNWNLAMSFVDANLKGTDYAPDGFVEWAMARGAVKMHTDAWKTYVKGKYPGKTFYFDLEIQP